MDFNIDNIMTVKKFHEEGYLQELNRQFLHPLGLALSVEIDGDNVSFGQIFDYRGDPEGMLYDYSLVNSDCFISKMKNVEKQFYRIAETRYDILGYLIQLPAVYK